MRFLNASSSFLPGGAFPFKASASEISEETTLPFAVSSARVPANISAASNMPSDRSALIWSTVPVRVTALVPWPVMTAPEFPVTVRAPLARNVTVIGVPFCCA